MLRVVQPEMLEFQFEGANPLIVKLERPLFGVEEAPVTLEFESPDQLTASYPVNGRIEGTSLTLDVANGVKIVGHLNQPEAPQPIKGFGNWMG
jgi:hypothetical protein